MAQNSKIEWTDHTVNLWWGCTKVHTGCKNCYAETLSKRWDNDIWGDDKQRKRIKSWWKDLNRYQKQAKKEGVMLKIFCGSMMDIFEDSKILKNPQGSFLFTEDLRDELFQLISIGEYDNLIFQFLTKRPENIGECIPESWHNGAPNNVWFGTSISDQATADDYIEKLVVYTPYNSNRYLSIEPQISCISKLDLRSIKWIIQGGESGPKKRPFDIKWAEIIKRICEEQNTPYFFKQIDKVQPIPEELLIREFPKLMQ